MLPCEVDVDRISEVRDLGCYHVSGKIGQELLSTVFAFKSGRVFSHFTAAILRHASRVIDSVIVFNARDVAIQEEEVVLVYVVLVTKALANLTDQIQITISLPLIPILTSVSTIVLVLLVHIRGTSRVATLAFVGFDSQTPDGLQRITLTTGHELSVPSLQASDAFVIHVNE